MSDWSEIQRRTQAVRDMPERAAAQLIEHEQQIASLRKQLVEKNEEFADFTAKTAAALEATTEVIQAYKAALNAREVGNWISPQTPPENGKVVLAAMRNGDYCLVYAHHHKAIAQDASVRIWLDHKTDQQISLDSIIGWASCPTPPAGNVQNVQNEPRAYAASSMSFERWKDGDEATQPPASAGQSKDRTS